MEKRETNNVELVKRITRDGLLLASLCVLGMFSIPMGDNVKVSLQLFVVFLISFLANSWLDCILITAAYLGLGMFMPIYAGFSSNISPTFRFVISFVVASPIMNLFIKIKGIPEILRLILSCLLGTLIVYAIGSVFLMAYLSIDYPRALMVAVVPYLPFDAIKIALAILIFKLLPKTLKEERKIDNEAEGE